MGRSFWYQIKIKRYANSFTDSCLLSFCATMPFFILHFSKSWTIGITFFPYLHWSSLVSCKYPYLRAEESLVVVGATYNDSCDLPGVALHLPLCTGNTGGSLVPLLWIFFQWLKSFIWLGKVERRGRWCHDLHLVLLENVLYCCQLSNPLCSVRRGESSWRS